MSAAPSASVADRLRACAVVPVIEIDDAGSAAALAGALADGGLPAVEITLRTPAGIDAIAAIAAARPDVLLGAGTLLTPAEVRAAADAGAAFGVSPGFDPEVAAAAADAGIPLIPGAVTATEVQACLRAGLTLLKFFPAITSGGLPALGSLAAPFRHRGLVFMPTGGISETTLPEWIARPEVAAVGGSWLAPKADVAAGAWPAIEERARRARTLVDEVRSSAGAGAEAGA
jgi:2-dehydro-3-deoxyphosphogluconate aldolase/(4S)-4-hydroxy-2-oxoglutarate aldolase